jgi:hypothetical protein
MDPAQLYHLLNDPTFKEPENMRATIHVHGDKASNWELGEKLGLSAEAVQLFRFACLEVKVELEVDPTGDSMIVAVDGKPVIRTLDKSVLAEAVQSVELYLDQEADFLAEEVDEDECDEERAQLAAIRTILNVAKQCLT